MQPIGRYYLPQHGKSVVSSRHAGQSTRLFKWKGVLLPGLHIAPKLALCCAEASMVKRTLLCAESFWKSTVYAALTTLAFMASYREKCALPPVLHSVDLALPAQGDRLSCLSSLQVFL